MITGGAEMGITPLSVSGFNASKALSTRNDDPQKASRPWDKDRYMSPDISEATDLLRTEKIWNAVRHYMENYHAKQVN